MMKKIVVFFAFAICNTIVLAQSTPEAFIGLLPTIPSDACTKKFDEREKFQTHLDSLIDLINVEISRRRVDEKAANKSAQQKAMNKYAQQYGLSPEDMQKLKNGNMSKADKQAIADKAMQNSNNMSYGEAKSISKATPEGKKAWAEGYSTEKLADMAADPNKTRDTELQYKSQNELMAMQKQIQDSLSAIQLKFDHQLQDIDNDPGGLSLLKDISEYQKEMAGKSDVTDIKKKIILKKMEYCRRFSPRLFNVVSNMESFTKASIPVYYRLEGISNRLFKLQTGVDQTIQPGSMGISVVKGFFQSLHGIFKYNILDGDEE